MRAGRVVMGALGASLVLAGVGPRALAQAMPDPKLISGVALPAADVPAGTVSVRVIRGGFDKNVADQPVDFTIDGKVRTVKTDAAGRAQVSDLKPGAHVKAATMLDGARIESQDIAIAAEGLRVVLVGVDPDAAKREAEDRRLAAGPAVKGLVVLGPESAIMVELQDDRLNIFYLIQIVNSARTPVDVGGPLVFDLPTGARGASLVEPSSKQATVIGPRLTVTGPFAPGATSVQVGFEMPFSGGNLDIDQKFPAALEQASVIMPQAAGLNVDSAQLPTKQAASDQGQPLIVARGPAIPAGGTLSFEITGLPHHPAWPRDLALALAGGIMAVGIWAAAFPPNRRRAA